jgi:hypothetical protein
MMGAAHAAFVWALGVTLHRDRPSEAVRFAPGSTDFSPCGFSVVFACCPGRGGRRPLAPQQPVVFPWLAAPSFQKAREIDTCSLLPKLRSLSALAEIVARLSPAFTIPRNLAG